MDLLQAVVLQAADQMDPLQAGHRQAVLLQAAHSQATAHRQAAVLLQVAHRQAARRQVDHHQVAAQAVPVVAEAEEEVHRVRRQTLVNLWSSHPTENVPVVVAAVGVNSILPMTTPQDCFPVTSSHHSARQLITESR